MRALLTRPASAARGHNEPQTARAVGHLRLGRYALAGFVASALTVAGAVAGGPSFVSHMAGAWFFGTPGGPLGFVSASSDRAPGVTIFAVYGGLAALGVVWFRLLKELRLRPGFPVRAIFKVVAAWGAPFLLAPPLFSRDVYSYAGQGAMVSFGINPYHYGTGVLGITRFNLLAGPVWAHTPSPYGPTFLSLDGFVTRLSDHQVLVDLVLLRFLALAGVVLIALCLPTLARAVRRDPAQVVLFGVGSPLVLATLVGGAHNDALMVGLLVAGLAAWKRFGPVPGIVLCALATGVKAPAALGIIVIGWNWVPITGVLRRMAHTLGAVVIGGATLAALSAVTGIGWGWVLSLTAPDKVTTGVTPVDALAHVIAGAMHLVGFGVPLSSVRPLTSVAGIAVAVVAGSVLLWRSPRIGALYGLGGALLLLALLSPVLWAWYLPWGIVVLGVVADGWLRKALMWLAVTEAMIGASSVVRILHDLAADGPLMAALVVLGVVACALAASRLPLVPPVVDEEAGPGGAGEGLRSLRPWAGMRARPSPATVPAGPPGRT